MKRMAKSIKSVWKAIGRALVPAVLGGVIYAQTAARGASGAAPAGAMNMATLSQTSAPLASRAGICGYGPTHPVGAVGFVRDAASSQARVCKQSRGH